jgi:hypothetical protein
VVEFRVTRAIVLENQEKKVRIKSGARLFFPVHRTERYVYLGSKKWGSKDFVCGYRRTDDGNRTEKVLAETSSLYEAGEVYLSGLPNYKDPKKALCNSREFYVGHPKRRALVVVEKKEVKK